LIDEIATTAPAAMPATSKAARPRVIPILAVLLLRKENLEGLASRGGGAETG
jgi:hypothetical protein